MTYDYGSVLLFSINMTAIRQSFPVSLLFCESFLTSKPGNGFQSETVRNGHITVGLPDDAQIGVGDIHKIAADKARILMAC